MHTRHPRCYEGVSRRALAPGYNENEPAASAVRLMGRSRRASYATERGRDRATGRHGGFTLVELLIVISILVVLAVVTVSTLNYSAEQQKVSEGARNVQSFINGAKDRAIFDRKPVGVRLVLDQNGVRNAAGQPVTVSSLTYIATPDKYDGTTLHPTISLTWEPTGLAPGHLQRLQFYATGGDNAPGFPGVDDPQGGGDGVVDNTSEFQLGLGGDVFLTDIQNDFNRFQLLGLLAPGVQIQLWKPGTKRLTFTLIQDASNNWWLSSPYPAAAVTDVMDLNFEITLLPAILPNQQARELPRGVVIDLDASRIANGLPTTWYNSTGTKYTDFMDIVFSPRGTGVGASSAFGLINLVLAEAKDVEVTVYPPLPSPLPAQYVPFYNVSSRPNHARDRIVTINPKSGSISISEINFTDANNNNVPDDPMRFAELGDVTQ